MPGKPVTLLIAGAGSRGAGYADYALQLPDEAKVVAVAEPRDHHRRQMVEKHAIPAGNVFSDWKEAAARPRLADAVIVATQDAMHVEPAVAFADLGYDILLEKPMAPDEAGCRRIHEAVTRNGVLFGVCHVLRYTAYTRCLKEVLDSGAIGEIVSMQHLEPVGWWHQAHSFVRGNWGNAGRSSFMLLAKSCHDLDWIRYVMGRRCERVSSFGSLKHFRAEERPEGAADRCLDCEIEPSCPYSAKRLYMDYVERGKRTWPASILTDDFTPEGMMKALREGPYGRCVYACDNDVVDNQVVNMQFDGGATAAFTMTAFTRAEGRHTRIFGTRGMIEGDSRRIRLFDFLTQESREVDSEAGDQSILGGHGGGDGGLMRGFIDAVAAKDQNLILSGPDESLETHLMVFAAERARLEDKVITLNGTAR